jgi:glucose dehydrogenase
MKKLILFFPFALVVLSPMLASAQSQFDGTWKFNMNNIEFSKKPDVFLLQNGTYECKTCAPPYTVKADGTDQAVSGYPYFDTIAIHVVNDRAIEATNKKNGKVVATSTSTVSPDGKTMSSTFSDSSNTNGGPPVIGKGELTLVAKGPAGSHAISGSWQASKMESLSDNGTVWTNKVSGNEITMTTPTGQSYSANLDGTDAPMKSDPGTTSVSVKMIGKNTLEETDKRDGKVIFVFSMTVASDGKTAKTVDEDKLRNTTSTATATKQ